MAAASSDRVVRPLRWHGLWTDEMRESFKTKNLGTRMPVSEKICELQSNGPPCDRTLQFSCDILQQTTTAEAGAEADREGSAEQRARLFLAEQCIECVTDVIPGLCLLYHVCALPIPAEGGFLQCLRFCDLVATRSVEARVHHWASFLLDHFSLEHLFEACQVRGCGVGALAAERTTRAPVADSCCLPVLIVPSSSVSEKGIARKDFVVREGQNETGNNAFQSAAGKRLLAGAVRFESTSVTQRTAVGVQYKNSMKVSQEVDHEAEVRTAARVAELERLFSLEQQFPPTTSVDELKQYHLQTTAEGARLLFDKAHCLQNFVSSRDLHETEDVGPGSSTSAPEHRNLEIYKPSATNDLPLVPTTGGRGHQQLSNDLPLSEEEEIAVHHKSPLFLHGRSGTGKTTVLLHRAVEHLRRTAGEADEVAESVSAVRVEGESSTSAAQPAVASSSCVLVVTASGYLASAIGDQFEKIKPQTVPSVAALSASAGEAGRTQKLSTPTSFRDVAEKHSFLSVSFPTFLLMLDRTIADGEYFFADENSVSGTSNGHGHGEASEQGPRVLLWTERIADRRPLRRRTDKEVTFPLFREKYWPKVRSSAAESVIGQGELTEDKFIMQLVLQSGGAPQSLETASVRRKTEVFKRLQKQHESSTKEQNKVKLDPRISASDVYHEFLLIKGHFYLLQREAHQAAPTGAVSGAKPISEQEYISAPPKGSSGFLAEQDRRAIYAAFLRYSTMLKERQEWDICDAAAQIWDRSLRYQANLWRLAVAGQGLDHYMSSAGMRGGATATNGVIVTDQSTAATNSRKNNKKNAGAMTILEQRSRVAGDSGEGESLQAKREHPARPPPDASSRVSCLLCDEAQDLLPCQLLLFQIVCGPNTECAFAGDTAQTIHFGRSFRFADLKDLWWKHFARPMDELQSSAFPSPLLLRDEQKKSQLDKDDDPHKPKKLSKQKQRAMKANKARLEPPAATSTKSALVSVSSSSSSSSRAEVMESAADLGGSAKNKKQPLDSAGTTKVQFLTKNFRTHQGVLDFAALVVDVLHEFFDRSVDRMPRETSTTSGVPPFLVCGLSRTDFVAKLFGTAPLPADESAFADGEKLSLAKAEPLRLRGPTPVPDATNAAASDAPPTVAAPAGTLGADQVILVQSEDGKRDVVAHFGPGVVVLTVCDSKGLEFDDVILWNFFSESDCDEKCWLRLYDYMEREVQRLVEDLVTTSTADPNQVSGEGIEASQDSTTSAAAAPTTSTWSPEDVQRREDERSRLLAQVEFLREGRALARNSRKTDPGSMWWSQWATALKILYVGVTRAKKKILLYETAPLAPGSAAKAAKDFFADSRLAFGVSEKAAMRWADISLQEEGDESAADVALSAFVQRSDEGAYVSRGHEFFQRGLYREAKNMYVAGNEHKLARRAEARSIAEQKGAHGDAALLLEEAGFFQEAAESFEKGGDVLRVLQCLDKTEDGEMILSKLEQMRLALAEASGGVGTQRGNIFGVEINYDTKDGDIGGKVDDGGVIAIGRGTHDSACTDESVVDSASSATNAGAKEAGGLTAAVSRLGSDEVKDLRAAIGRLWAKYSSAAKEAARYQQLRIEYGGLSCSYPPSRAGGVWLTALGNTDGKKPPLVDLTTIHVPSDVNTLEDLVRLFLIHKPKGETAEFLPAVSLHYPNTQKARLKTLLGKLRREMAEGGVLAQLNAAPDEGPRVSKRAAKAVKFGPAKPQAATGKLPSHGVVQFEEFSPAVQAVIASKPKFLSGSNSIEVAKLFSAASTSFSTRLQIKRSQRLIAELQEQTKVERALLGLVTAATAVQADRQQDELEEEIRRLQKEVRNMQATANEAEKTMDAALAPLRSEQLCEVYFEAARKGLLSLLQKLILDKHVSIYTRESKTGNSILHATVSSRRKELLTWLLSTECYGMLALHGRKRGFSWRSEDERAKHTSRWVFLKNKRGETALLLAVRTGELCIANEFFDHADFAAWAWYSLLRPVARKIASREHVFRRNELPNSERNAARALYVPRAAPLPRGYCSDSDSGDDAGAESDSSQTDVRAELSSDEAEEMSRLNAERARARLRERRGQRHGSTTPTIPAKTDHAYYMQVLQNGQHKPQIREFLQARETQGHQMKSRIDFVMQRAQLLYLDAALRNATTRDNYEEGWSFEEDEAFWFLQWWFSVSSWPWWRRYSGNRCFDVVEWGRHARARTVAARMTEHLLTCARLAESRPLCWFFSKWGAPAWFRSLEPVAEEEADADYEADEDDEIARIDDCNRRVSYRDRYSEVKTSARYINIFEAAVYGADRIRISVNHAKTTTTPLLVRHVLGLRISENGIEHLSEAEKLMRDWESTDFSLDIDRKCNADEWYHSLLWDHWPAKVDHDGCYWPDWWGFFDEQVGAAVLRDFNLLAPQTHWAIRSNEHELAPRPPLHHVEDYGRESAINSSSDEEEEEEQENCSKDNKQLHPLERYPLIPELPHTACSQGVEAVTSSWTRSLENHHTPAIPKLPCGGRAAMVDAKDPLKSLYFFAVSLNMFRTARKAVLVSHAGGGDPECRRAENASGVPQSHLTSTEFTSDRRKLVIDLFSWYWKRLDWGRSMMDVQDMPRLDVYVAADDWYFLYWLITEKQVLNLDQYILDPVAGSALHSESVSEPPSGPAVAPSRAERNTSSGGVDCFQCDLCRKTYGKANRFKLLCGHVFCRRCMVDEVPAYETDAGYSASYSFRVAEALRTRGIRTPQSVVPENRYSEPERSFRTTVADCYSSFVTSMALGGMASENHDAEKSSLPKHQRDPPIDLQLKHKKCPCCRKDAYPGIAEALLIRLLRALNGESGVREACQLGSWCDQRRFRNPYVPRVRIIAGTTVGDALLALAAATGAVQVFQMLAFPTDGPLQSKQKNFMVNLGAVDPWSSVVDGKNVMHFAVLHRQASIVKLLGENGFLDLAQRASIYEELGPRPRTPIEELLLSPHDYRSMRGFVAYFARKNMLTFGQWEVASAQSQHAETKRWRRELSLDKAFGERFSEVHQLFEKKDEADMGLVTTEFGEILHTTTPRKTADELEQPQLQKRCESECADVEQDDACSAALHECVANKREKVLHSSSETETRDVSNAAIFTFSQETNFERAGAPQASPTSTTAPAGSPDSSTSSLATQSPAPAKTAPSAENTRLGTLYEMIRNPRCTGASLTKFLDTALMLDSEVLDRERGSEGAFRSVDKSLRVKCAFAAFIFGRSGIVASGRIDLLRECFVHMRNWPHRVWAARMGLAWCFGADGDQNLANLAFLQCGESLRPFVETIRGEMSQQKRIDGAFELELDADDFSRSFFLCKSKKECRLHEYEYEQGVDLLRLATSLYHGNGEGDSARQFGKRIACGGSPVCESDTGKNVRCGFLNLFDEMVEARACCDELREERLQWRLARVIERCTRSASMDDKVIRAKLSEICDDANARVAALTPAVRKLYQESSTDRGQTSRDGDYSEQRRHETLSLFPISPTTMDLLDFIKPQEQKTSHCTRRKRLPVPIPVGESLYTLAVVRGHLELADWFLDLECAKDNLLKKAKDEMESREVDEIMCEIKSSSEDETTRRSTTMYMSLPTAVHRTVKGVCESVFLDYPKAPERGFLCQLHRCRAIYGHLSRWLDSVKARSVARLGRAATQQFSISSAKDLLAEFVYYFDPEDHSPSYGGPVSERTFLEVAVWMARDTLGNHMYGSGCEHHNTSVTFAKPMNWSSTYNASHRVLDVETSTLIHETTKMHMITLMGSGPHSTFKDSTFKANAVASLAHHIARVCMRQIARKSRQGVLAFLDWVLEQPGVSVNASGTRLCNGVPKEDVVEEARKTLKCAEEQGHTVRSTASAIPAFRCMRELTHVQRPILFARSLFDISDLPTSYWLMRELIKRGADPTVRGVLSGRRTRHRIARDSCSESVKDGDVAEPVKSGTLVEQILRLVFAKDRPEASWDPFIGVGTLWNYTAQHDEKVRKMLARDEATVAELERRAVEDRNLDWEVSSASDIEDDGDQICGPVLTDRVASSDRPLASRGVKMTTAACSQGDVEAEIEPGGRLSVADLFREQAPRRRAALFRNLAKGTKSIPQTSIDVHAPPREETGEAIAVFAASNSIDEAPSSGSSGDEENSSRDDVSAWLEARAQRTESGENSGSRTRQLGTKRRLPPRFPSMVEAEVKNCHILQHPEQYSFRQIEALPPHSSKLDFHISMANGRQAYEVLAPGRRRSRTAAILENGGVAGLLKPIACGADRREMYSHALRAGGARGIRSLQRHLYLRELEYCLQHCEPIRDATPSQQRGFVMNFKMKKRILSLYDVIEWLAIEHDVDIQCLNVTQLLDEVEKNTRNRLIPLPITQKQIDQLKRTQATKRLSLVAQTSVEQNKDSRKTTGSSAKKANKK